MWKTLLVPHDFSPCADAALAQAADLALVHGASILVLHVSSLPPNVPADARIAPPDAKEAQRLDEYVLRGVNERLGAIAAPLRAGGLVVDARARIGDVEDEILAAVASEGVSAIVMGTHGREGLSHFLVGSIAEKVVRRSPVPVVTVRTPGARAKAIAEEQIAEDELAG